jgi:hypothetical protein
MLNPVVPVLHTVSRAPFGSGAAVVGITPWRVRKILTEGAGPHSRHRETLTADRHASVQQLEGRAVERPSRVGVRVPQRPPPALGREGEGDGNGTKTGDTATGQPGRARRTGSTGRRGTHNTHPPTHPGPRDGSDGRGTATEDLRGGGKGRRGRHTGAHVRPRGGEGAGWWVRWLPRLPRVTTPMLDTLVPRVACAARVLLTDRRHPCSDRSTVHYLAMVRVSLAEIEPW